MNYRAEVDGLRALAVIPVILFHAGFELFSGGYVGVDVFFVISGYLITTIILGEIQQGNFSLLRFYERRARRILPALFFMVILCLPLSWLWLMPSDFQNFAQSVVAVAIFSSNILFWHESGYFSTAAELKPLLHTWSLAVEEQYYILYPLFLIIAWRFGRHAVVLFLVGAFIASLALAEWTAHHAPSAGFYLLPTRGFELLIGCFAAFHLQREQRPSPSFVLTDIFAGLGFLMIVTSIFLFDKETPFPGLYALLPTLGTVLIILFATGGTTVNRLLSQRWIVGIGLISYSAYLYHQPLFAFARSRALGEPGLVQMCLLIILSFLTAFLSWKYVEKPFRIGGVVSRSMVSAISVSTSVFLIGLGILVNFFEGFPQRLETQSRNIVLYANDKNPKQEHCLVRSGFAGEHPLPGCAEFFVDDRVDVMMIGDSHSDAIAYQVQRVLWKRGIGSYAVSYLGCAGLPGFTRVVSMANRIDPVLAIKIDPPQCEVILHT